MIEKEKYFQPQPSHKEKEKEFLKMGFSEKAVSYLVTLVKDKETLLKKMEKLKTLGFENPQSLIEKFPQIAGLDIERVVNELQELGFNPHLIEKFPQIAGLGIERIKSRIKLIERLNKKFSLDYDPIKIIEGFPQYLSYKKERLFFNLRIASFYNLDEKSYREIIRENPYLLFSLLKEELPKDSQEFLYLARKLRILSKEEKERKISEIRNQLPEIVKEFQEKFEKTKSKEDEFLFKLARDLLKYQKEKIK